MAGSRLSRPFFHSARPDRFPPGQSLLTGRILSGAVRTQIVSHASGAVYLFIYLFIILLMLTGKPPLNVVGVRGCAASQIPGVSPHADTSDYSACIREYK